MVRRMASMAGWPAENTTVGAALRRRQFCAKRSVERESRQSSAATDTQQNMSITPLPLSASFSSCDPHPRTELTCVSRRSLKLAAAWVRRSTPSSRNAELNSEELSHEEDCLQACVAL
jgi:hypothetical protein